MKKSNYNIIGKPPGGKQITKTANLSSVAVKESDSSIQSSEVSVIRTTTLDEPRMKTNKTSLSPLKNGELVETMDYGDIMIGLQSLRILKQVPSFNGISIRVPEVYVLDSVSMEEISLVPHLRALTTMIRSCMARRIVDNNIKLKACYKYFTTLISFN